jgi:hypothetical protein
MVDCVLGNKPPPAFITNFLGTSGPLHALLVFAAAASLPRRCRDQRRQCTERVRQHGLEQLTRTRFAGDLFSQPRSGCRSTTTT